VIGVIAALVAGGMIATSILGSGGDSPTPPATVSGGDTTALLAGIPQRGPVVGRRGAPVTLVEFADFQCPFCGEWSRQAFPDIVRQYVRSGNVRLVFRGLHFIGPDSEKALRFALAAGRQQKLWHAVDLLYANQGGENSGWVTDELLASIGRAIPDFQLEKALADMSSPAVTAQMRAADDLAVGLGVRETPSFAAGKTRGGIELVSVPTLTADGLRPTLDTLLGR
jgi:protein-disulfide isomerase